MNPDIASTALPVASTLAANDTLLANASGVTSQISRGNLLSGDETIAGIKTFSSTIAGTITAAKGLRSATTTVATDAATAPTSGQVLTASGGSAASWVTPSVTLSADGWSAITDSWAYASATTITVPTDATTVYSVGDKLKLTQSSTVKYFYITAVSATVLTINGGSDYTLANSAISAQAFSKAVSPVGHPIWFNFAPTYTGFSSNPTGGANIFAVQGRVAEVSYARSSAGTSNSSVTSVSLPVTSSAIVLRLNGPIPITDNGTSSLGFYSNEGSASVNAVDIYKDATGTLLTASGSKNIFGTLRYPI